MLQTLPIWREAKRVIRDTPFIQSDEAEALSHWLFELGLTVSSVSKAQDSRRPAALKHGRRKAKAVVKDGGDPKAQVSLPERDSALVKLLEGVL